MFEDTAQPTLSRRTECRAQRTESSVGSPHTSQYTHPLYTSSMNTQGSGQYTVQHMLLPPVVEEGAEGRWVPSDPRSSFPALLHHALLSSTAPLCVMRYFTRVHFASSYFTPPYYNSLHCIGTHLPTSGDAPLMNLKNKKIIMQLFSNVTMQDL